MITAIFGNNSGSPHANQESAIISMNEKPIASGQDDDLDAYLAELGAEQQQSSMQYKTRKAMEKSYDEFIEQEMWELEKTTKDVFSSSH